MNMTKPCHVSGTKTRNAAAVTASTNVTASRSQLLLKRVKGEATFI